MCATIGPALGQRDGKVEITQRKAEARTLVGVENEYLAAGAEALLEKRYDEGIRLTQIGLERPTKPKDRADALSNLCAAYAAKRQPDMAIQYCDESLTINGQNWHALSNRAYAHYLKHNYAAADSDLDKALALKPEARTLPQIRGLMNERRLRGRVTIEEHQ
jgi:tetratricopeptide (TPR) repeat protein